MKNKSNEANDPSPRAAAHRDNAAGVSRPAVPLQLKTGDPVVQGSAAPQPVVQRVKIYPDKLLQQALNMPQVINTRTKTKEQLEAIYEALTHASENRVDAVRADQRGEFQTSITSVTIELLDAIFEGDYKKEVVENNPSPIANTNEKEEKPVAVSRKLVLREGQLEEAMQKAPKPGDLKYSGHFSMHHKIPRHVLEAWFERAVKTDNVELLEKMAIISNRPGEQYLTPAPGGVAVTNMKLFKSHATHPRWDLFEGPLSDHRDDDAHEKPDAHYADDGSKTPRSEIAHQILDIGIDEIDKGTLESMMQKLNEQGLGQESPIVKNEWRNDVGELWGRGSKYQWNDPQNAAVKANVNIAKERRAEEQRARSRSQGLGGLLSSLREQSSSTPVIPIPKPLQQPSRSVQPPLPAPFQPGLQVGQLSESDVGKVLKKLQAPDNKSNSEWKTMGHVNRAKFYLANTQHFGAQALAVALESTRAQLPPGAWKVSDVEAVMLILAGK